MSRLYIFGEGSTETTFGDDVIKEHLALHNVFVQGCVEIAHCKKKGKVHRGGGRKYVPMKNDICRFLKQEKGADVFFTTMIDLYAIPQEFPGLEEADGYRVDAYKRVGFLEECFAKDIGDPRFIPNIQLHEFEALLFVQPSVFSTFYADCEDRIAKLVAIAAGYKSPELINDGQHTAPSIRIANVFLDYDAAKAAAGPQLAKATGLDLIREKCPHFGAWLKRLEKLGTK